MSVLVSGIIIVMLISLGLNIPLGIWRTRSKKFSLNWFLSVHIAVPLIFVLRISEHLALWTIPFFVLSSITGQLLGGLISQNLLTNSKILSE